MDLLYVETFYRAAMLRNLSQAANELRISQGTAANRIKQLENQLHPKARLVDRSRAKKKEFRLTREGERFLLHARRLLDLEHEVKTELDAERETPTRLRIGAIESVLHSWLVALVEELTSERPRFEFELTVDTTIGLMELAERGRLDVVFATAGAGRSGIAWRPLAPMPMAFVGSREQKAKRSYSIHQLADGNLLTFQRGSLPHVNLMSVLRKAKIERARVHAISSISAMARLAARGFGIATLPIPVLASLANDELRVIRCSQRLDLLPIHASYRTDLPSEVIDDVISRAARLSSAAAKDQSVRDLS